MAGSSVSKTGDCSGKRNLSTESSSRPTRWMSAGIGEYPIGSKKLTALIFTSAWDKLLDKDAVVQFLTRAVSIVDAFGQQECEKV